MKVATSKTGINSFENENVSHKILLRLGSWYYHHIGNIPQSSKMVSPPIPTR